MKHKIEYLPVATVRKHNELSTLKAEQTENQTMKDYSQLTAKQQNQVTIQWTGYRVNDYMYTLGRDGFVLSRRRTQGELGEAEIHESRQTELATLKAERDELREALLPVIHGTQWITNEQIERARAVLKRTEAK